MTQITTVTPNNKNKLLVYLVVLKKLILFKFKIQMSFYLSIYFKRIYLIIFYFKLIYLFSLNLTRKV